MQGSWFQSLPGCNLEGGALAREHPVTSVLTGFSHTYQTRQNHSTLQAASLSSFPTLHHVRQHPLSMQATPDLNPTHRGLVALVESRARRDVFAEIDEALDTQRSATRELFDELDHRREEELPCADVERLLQRLAPNADRATCHYIRRQVHATGDDRQVRRWGCLAPQASDFRKPSAGCLLE